MNPIPDHRERAVLKAVAEAGGYHLGFGDLEDAESCVARGWLLPDGESAYAITYQGRLALKPLWH